MFSARSCSALVMNRLTPSRCHVPSGCSTALVRPTPTSEPASGSVSTIVEPHLRSTMSWAICFWSGVPSRSRIAPKPGPDMYMNAAGLAPSSISEAAQRSDGGAPVPPRCSGRSSRNHSASISVSNDRRNDSGKVTVDVAGSKTGGVRSPSTNEAASSFSASRRTSASTSRAVSASMSAYGPLPSTSPRPSTSNKVNSMSRRLLL